MFLCLELLLGDLGYCGGASEVSGRDVTVETRHSHAALQKMQAASRKLQVGNGPVGESVRSTIRCRFASR
jgi:hypothetical protein